MKSIKKKLISLLMFICMVSVLLPIQAPVYAASTYGDYVVAVYFPGSAEYTEGSALRLTGEGKYEISMASGVTTSSIPIIVDTDADATIVLDGVNISSDTAPPITIYDADDSHTVTIKLNGTNTLTSTYSDYTTGGMAGLEKQSTGELIITSYSYDGSTDGELIATGGYRGAGIGGGMYDENFDNITINGGTIIATGGENAAGIGGGGYYYEEVDFYTTKHPSHGSGIKITGGNVTATGTGGGAGIGSGKNGSFTDIEISGGTVTATGSENAAGIGGAYLSDYGHTSNNIKITGGTVTATGGENAAGIGGGSGVTGSEIAISDCTVTATGGENGAGIGGGTGGGGTGISISESTVTATGGTNAAGIGGGSGGDGSNISITSGYIKTEVSGDGSDIGAGYGGSSSDLTITGGCFNAETGDVTLGENGKVYGISVGSERTVYENKDVSNGSTYPYFVSDTCDFKVETDASAGYGTGYGYGGDLKIQLVILTGGEFTISMADGIGSTSYDRIYVASDDSVTVKLNNVNIESSSSPPLDINAVGDVVIELIGENTLNSSAADSAGLQKSSTDNSLEIRNADDDNPGSLTATGGYQAAGIGGGYCGAGSNITITGGTIEAAGGGSDLSFGGSCGAGIGGGYCGPGSNITITGGTVTASAGVSKYCYSGAGIGGGCYGEGSNITITGGTVTATGSSGGAGIGGGQGGKGSNIAISGGTVVADSYTNGNDGGAAIGGGYAAAGNNIEISGGDVTATGSTWYACGIGGGYFGKCDGIVISGGTVTASGAMGIGGDHGGNITISGGYFNLSRGGISPGAYIGCNSGYSATVSVTGGYFADSSATVGLAGVGTVYDITVADSYEVCANTNDDTKTAYPYYVKDMFGDRETDSGKYYAGNVESEDNLYGVVRFLQEYEGTADKYGFYFISSEDAEILDDTVCIYNDTSAALNGFYGDVTQIAKDNYETTIYAKAFVVIDDTTYYSKVNSGIVGSDPKLVDDPTATATPSE